MGTIDAKYLTKVYKNGVYALKNCSLSVKKGELLVVVGESGSGKSTLLKVLAGTESISSGELYFDGMLADNIPTAKRGVSMVFQEYVLYPHMTVFDNLATPLKIAGEDEKSIYDRVMDALRLFGLEIVADVKPKHLSGGEQQRVALAKALLRRSKLVLLDEPMSNIDEKSRWDYCIAVKKMKKMLPDATFIYVTHNTKEAISLGDRIAVMKDGAILQIGSADFLTSHFEHLTVMELLGISKNIQKGKYIGGRFIFNGVMLKNVPEFVEHSRLSDGQNVICAQSNIDDSIHLFDESEKSLFVSSSQLKLNGSLEKNTLTFANMSLELNSEYMSRLMRRPKCVSVCMSTEKFSKIPLSDCFSLIFTVKENSGEYVQLETSDKSFLLNAKTNLQKGERIRLYYKNSDLILYDGDVRLTCHYPLRRRIKVKVINADKGVIEILGKRVKLGKSIPENIGYAKITGEAFELSYSKGSISVGVSECLDEEFINQNKLMHIGIKGHEGYLSFLADENITCFGKNKVWLNITPKELELKMDK